jgi:hypothetical protein
VLETLDLVQLVSRNDELGVCVEGARARGGSVSFCSSPDPISTASTMRRGRPTSVSFPQQSRPLLNLRLLPPRLQRLNIDSDPKDLNIAEPTLELDSLGSGLDVLKHPRDGLSEVSGEVVGLEADEVRAEHAGDELFAFGEAAENLGGGEGDVEKELIGKGEGEEIRQRRERERDT